MGAAVAVEVPAARTRERLAEFVGEVVSALPHVRQRENALVYVRGLIEQGGRKSLQPTLFRLEESPARYESVQQFLADSPWDAELLVRACAERVAPAIAVTAWIVDDTGIVKDGKHSPGVKRQYSGTLGKIGNCQVTVSVHAVGVRGTLPLGFALYLPEEWCADPARRRKAKIPEQVVFQTKSQLAALLVERASGWQLPAAPILADCAYGDNSAFRTRLHTLEHELPRRRLRPGQCLRARDDLCRTGPARSDRATTVGRPTRPRTRVATGAREATAPDGVADAPLPPNTRGRGRRGPLRIPRRRRHSPRPQRPSAATTGVADHRVARRRGGAVRLLALQPGRRQRTRAARAARQAALDDRARLPATPRRTLPRPLRRQKLRRLPPPLRAGHLPPRLPHPLAPMPESPAAGLTLPQTVLLLQPVLRCWADRCRTCHQPVDLEQLDLFHRRQ